jgi:hypothetical protein
VKRALLSAVLALAAPASAAAQDPPEFNAMCGDIACRVERVPVKWQVLSVSEDSSTLQLVYETGGCRLSDGRAAVAAGSSRIRIGVDVGEVVAIATPDRQVVCTQEIRYETLRVQLRRAVAGRPIRGDSVISSGRAKRVPRVIDLAFADARQALRAQGFHVRRYGERSGRVMFQSPASGRRGGNVVGLTIGRHTFHARSLKSCLAGAGVAGAVAGRPAPGDEDAPDLEIVVDRPGARVLVALYADPARAREKAAVIRHEARRSDAAVERAGRVTLVWAKPPYPALREAVLGCVAGAQP